MTFLFPNGILINESTVLFAWRLHAQTRVISRNPQGSNDRSAEMLAPTDEMSELKQVANPAFFYAIFSVFLCFHSLALRAL